MCVSPCVHAPSLATRVSSLPRVPPPHPLAPYTLRFSRYLFVAYPLIVNCLLFSILHAIPLLVVGSLARLLQPAAPVDARKMREKNASPERAICCSVSSRLLSRTSPGSNRRLKIFPARTIFRSLSVFLSVSLARAKPSPDTEKRKVGEHGGQILSPFDFIGSPPSPLSPPSVDVCRPAVFRSSSIASNNRYSYRQLSNAYLVITIVTLLLVSLAYFNSTVTLLSLLLILMLLLSLMLLLNHLFSVIKYNLLNIGTMCFWVLLARSCTRVVSPTGSGVNCRLICTPSRFPFRPPSRYVSFSPFVELRQMKSAQEVKPKKKKKKENARATLPLPAAEYRGAYCARVCTCVVWCGVGCVFVCG